MLRPRRSRPSRWATVGGARGRNQVLADRLESIHQLFGQIPDTLEDVWVKLALESEQEALQLIDRTAATQNPFDAKYSKVEDADWETCALVLDPLAVREQLSCGW